MREFIAIVEAKRKALPIDPTVQVQAIYDKALATAKVLGPALMIRQWDQSLVTALRQAIQQAKQAHDANEAKEARFHDEPYQPQPFVVSDVLLEITTAWWQRTVEPKLDEIGWAAKDEYERYQDDHPQVEQSDEMSRLQAEVALTTKLRYNGSDTNEGLQAILGALDDFMHTIQSYRYIDHTHLVTRETEDLVSALMPAILTVCRMRGAKPSA